MFVKAPPSASQGRAIVLFAGTNPLFSGIHGVASAATVGGLFLFFLKAGAFVFGSGLAIVPFLYGGVVVKFHWLTEHQFVDAVAVAMITPGPVVITAASIGYLRGRRGGRRPCSLCSLCTTLFHHPVWRSVLQAICAEPASESFCSRRHGCSRGRNRRSCIHPGAPLTRRHSDSDHRNCDSDCTDADEENTRASHDFGCGKRWSSLAP